MSENSQNNEGFVEILGKLEDIMTRKGDHIKARAYKKAQESLMDIKEPIKTAKQLEDKPGIGKSIIKKFEEYSKTGTLAVLEKEKTNPVNILTGVYGSQRILNGKPRRPHYGIDFHAPEGTPVKAMMDGEVPLAEDDMSFTGGTIIFDHGHGVSTLYMHMKDINVKVGQKIKQGQIVGTLGQSGRATGPHLDIRLNWFDVKLDPASVLN